MVEPSPDPSIPEALHRYRDEQKQRSRVRLELLSAVPVCGNRVAGDQWEQPINTHRKAKQRRKGPKL
ncbi:MAG: hypothetical protein K2H61_04475 [Muribaculaceae bacterium]|nr:hypothetical protein [Muribaculaceae bacterium]